MKSDDFTNQTNKWFRHFVEDFCCRHLSGAQNPSPRGGQRPHRRAEPQPATGALPFAETGARRQEIPTFFWMLI